MYPNTIWLVQCIEPHRKYTQAGLLVFFIILWFGLECARSSSFSLTCLIIYMNRLYRAVRYWVQREGDPKKLPFEYNCMVLGMASARKELNAMAYFVLTSLFWIVVLLAWLLVCSSSLIIGRFFYSVVWVATIAIVLGIGLVLPLLCKATEIAKELSTMHNFTQNGY